MRRVIPLLLCCLFASGCFVFDELEAGDKVLDQLGPGKNAAAPAQPAPAPQAGAGWWANAKSIGDTPADTRDPAVACTIGGSMRFMRRSDCLSQGGQPDK